jgi:hypothetical protein
VTIPVQLSINSCFCTVSINKDPRSPGIGSEGVWGFIDSNADEDILDNGDGALELVSLTNEEAIVVITVSY